MKEFVNLHGHTDMSLLDGYGPAKDMAAHAASIGYKALAVTEHGNLLSAVPFVKACHEYDIKPIVGMEAYYFPGDRRQRPQKGQRFPVNAMHLILLAKDEEGWLNLKKLSSAAYLEGHYYKPRIDPFILRDCSKGIIAISGCLNGILNRYYLREEDSQKALNQAELMKDIFGDDFYLEVQFHPLKDQYRANQFIKTVSSDMNIPMVATLDSHYIKKEDSEVHDVLMCMATDATINDVAREMKYLDEEYYLKSPAEVWDSSEAKDFKDCLRNSVEIAEKINLDIPLGEYHLPVFTPDTGESPEEWFVRELDKGLVNRADMINYHCDYTKKTIEDYRERLEYEKGIISNMGFESYFLILSDAIRYLKNSNVRVAPGRGSVGGSLAAWLLDITEVDPLRFDLQFERFLNPDRVALPDIDNDTGSAGREKVIAYLKEKYGEDCVSNICTFSRIKARSAIKDVGRVMEMPFPVRNNISTMIPLSGRREINLEEAYKMVPALEDLREKNPKLFEYAEKLENTPRHLSVHAGGIVIAPKPLVNYLPLMVANPDEGGDKKIAVQGDMHIAEDVGLVKMDWLVTTSLDVIQSTVDSIYKHEGVSVDPDKLPLNDEPTFEMLRAGKTEGVFQLGTGLMKQLTIQIQPKTIEDIALINALARPGAEAGTKRIINCIRGDAKPRYLLPELEPILKETYGELVYQEQAIAIAKTIAGFTPGRADTLRKAIGKKLEDLMNELETEFIDGAVARGFGEEIVKTLWKLISAGKEYSFNKAHAIAYGLEAYQTAYLKANYPAHFLAATLTAEAKDRDKLGLFLRVAQDMGLEILPLDINISKKDFVYENGGIRYGLCAVPGLAEKALDTLEIIRTGVDEMKLFGYHFFRATERKPVLHVEFKEKPEEFDINVLKRLARSYPGNHRIFYRKPTDIGWEWVDLDMWVDSNAVISCLKESRTLKDKVRIWTKDFIG